MEYWFLTQFVSLVSNRRTWYALPSSIILYRRVCLVHQPIAGGYACIERDGLDGNISMLQLIEVFGESNMVCGGLFVCCSQDKISYMHNDFVHILASQLHAVAN